ncbi:MAG: TonB-dependent receptor, partial [Pseudolabrys sp.]|nr:TonB-dependent receptor [Pseudolabrys sp.]
PYLQSISETPGPKVTNRDSFSMQADWRPASGHLISAGVQANYYHAFFDNQITNYSVGSAAPLSYAPDFVDGANGGQITQERFAFDKIGAMVAGRISHRFINRTWEIDSGLSGSRSRSAYRDSSGGHFFDAQTKLLNVSRVRFDGIVNSLPAKITPVDSAGNAINYVDLNNYLLTQVSTGPRDGSEELLTARLNVKRNLDFLPFRATVKIGGLMSEQKRILDRSGSTMTFLGPDGIANTADDNASLYRAPNSIGTANVFSGRPSPQYVDLFRLWQLYKDRPAYFSNTLSQQVSTLNTAYSNAKTIKEVITAGYVQLEAKFWQDRMRVVTGVRYEKTQDLGRGPQRDDSAVFQRDAAGKFATDSNGAKIRKPEAGAPGSLEEFALTRNTRGAKTDRSYDGYNPSVHFTFNITKDIILRAAYASTFGRPDFGNISPGVTLNENQSANPPPGATPGSITVINSGLKPFTAKNYDLSLEYYFPKGGLVTVGVFRKDLTDFFASSTVLATPEILASLDLDPKYVGWDVTTRYNVAEAAQITGIEFNYDQTLAFLPGWGKYFKFNANYTKLRLLGARQTDFSSFIPVAGNLGLSFSNKKLLVMVNENYRGRQTRGTSGITPNAFQYYAPRGTLDINVDYKVFKKLTLFANVRNATNKAFVREIYSADSPFYTHQQLRQNYGSLWTFGVKGSF